METLTREGAMQMLNKVPEVTLYFWIIKIMCTTVGETAADFLNADLHFGLTGTSIVMSILLAIFVIMQLRRNKYVPWLYWVVVVLVSIVGTLITDNLVDNFGVALETTTIAFSLALLATFVAWYASEKTLSIHSIFTKKRELFYYGHFVHVCLGYRRRRPRSRRFKFGLCEIGGDIWQSHWHCYHRILRLQGECGSGILDCLYPDPPVGSIAWRLLVAIH